MLWWVGMLLAGALAVHAANVVAWLLFTDRAVA